MSFFVQAEDGIRDGHVTGVQTCALPISQCCMGIGERIWFCVITKKDNIQITKGKQERFDEILSDEAISFLESLHNKFEAERVRLLDERTRLQVKLNEGEKFDFLPETKEIRDGNWTISPLPEDLKDRRVEITGPVGRNMVINALNSGAKTFMACFEDATAPTWNNMIDGRSEERRVG